MSDRGCKTVGIDLGTTYSALAYIDLQNTPRIMCDNSGQAVMPSVVYFADDEIIVGEMALTQAKVNADHAVQFVKAQMGEAWRKTFNGQEHTPESISALILGQLVREAEPQLGPVKDAVITVPAYFTEKRRRATEQAGQIAGLNVVGTLNEPMAAMLAYGLHHQARADNVVVYDLGGGTFDVTVVRVTPNTLEELATTGNRQLGGRDWDEALVNYVCDDFQKHHHKDPRDDPQVMQNLLLDCEQTKRRLGRLAKASIRINALGCNHVVEITAAKFDDLTAHLLQATKITTEIAIEDAGLTWKQVSRIVLVGGSTNMPSVRNMLKEVAHKPPDVGVNPVTAVALGAAIYGQVIESGAGMKIVHQAPQVDPVTSQQSAVTPAPQPKATVARPMPVSPTPSPTAGAARPTPVPITPQVKPTPVPATPLPGARPTVPQVVQPVSLTPRVPVAPVSPGAGAVPTVSFVTAHGVGVKVFSQKQIRNLVLIPKNTRVPCKVQKVLLTTHRDASARGGKEISIEVMQGDTPDVDLAETLGVGKIRGIPPEDPPGQPVEVTMEFDEQGRLHMSAIYKRTGQLMTMSVDIQGGLREEDVNHYRDFMLRSGFRGAFDQAQALAGLNEASNGEDDSDDDLVTLEPI